VQRIGRSSPCCFKRGTPTQTTALEHTKSADGLFDRGGDGIFRHGGLSGPPGPPKFRTEYSAHDGRSLLSWDCVSQVTCDGRHFFGKRRSRWEDIPRIHGSAALILPRRKGRHDRPLPLLPASGLPRRETQRDRHCVLGWLWELEEADPKLVDKRDWTNCPILIEGQKRQKSERFMLSRPAENVSIP